MAFDETGDQQVVADDQRIDKPDFNGTDSFAALLQATFLRGIGGLMGFGGDAGVAGVGPPSGVIFGGATSYDTGSKDLTIGAALLWESTTDTSPSGAPQGRVLKLDPTVQSGVINLSTQAGTNASCMIWASRTVTNTRLRTRKRWLPAAAAETTFGTNVRGQERVALAVTSATIDGSGLVTATGSPPDSSYFPFIVIPSWSGVAPNGTPTVRRVSVWDGTRQGTPNAMAFYNRVRTRIASSGPGSTAAYGLWTLLYNIRQSIAYIRDSTGTENWDYSGSYRGLKQIDPDLQAVENKTKRFVLASARVVDVGAGWVIGGGGVNTGLTLGSVSTGDFAFTIVDYAYAAADSFNVNVTQMSNGVTPSNRLFPQWTDLGSGTFGVYFFDSGGTLTAPSANGFSVVVTSRETA